MNKEQILKIVFLLKQNKIIAIPTDTIYGLSCVINKCNINTIYRIKKRNKSKNLIIISGFIEHIKKFLDLSKIKKYHWEKIHEYSYSFPVTWIAPKTKNKKYCWFNNLDKTVAFRITHLDLIKNITYYLNNAIISTSANLSLQKHAASYEEVVKIFSNKIDFIMQSSDVEKKSPSKIIDLLTDKIIRS